MTKPSRLLAFFCICSFSGCSTPTGSSSPAEAASRKPSKCAIEFFADENRRPERPYTLVIKTESHVQRNIFFGGKATLDEAYRDLRKQACQLGADAVIVDDHVESVATEFSHVHVWASLVRYVDGSAGKPGAQRNP